jgi:bifunctional non-homologous end joining protein LigD
MKMRPMLVTSGPLRPDSDKYAFEVKWDGFRALIDASPDGVTVWSRNGYDMTSRYPELEALGGVVRKPLLLDGEIVCLVDERPDFAALWFRTRGSAHAPVCFMAFDLLEHNGSSLVDLPYRERRKILEALELNGSHWHMPESQVGEGAALFTATKEMGLEGVVAKHLDSRYRPGIRSRSWIKTKHMQTRTFALLGWVPPEEWRGNRGCVALGLQSGHGIAFAGVVESRYGFELVARLPWLTRAELRELHTPGRVWHREDLQIGEVKYLEWSPAGGFRHASIVSAD